MLVITEQQSTRGSYRRALQEEIDASRFVDSASLDRLRINKQPVLDYKSLLFCGDPTARDYAAWAESLPDRIGSRDRCLSLGAGMGRIERRLIDIGFTDQFQAIELSPHTSRHASRLETRFRPTEGDLNFLSLEPDSLDFVLCHGVLHHLINIEHVLYQIHKALRPDGVVLFYEYVGEDRWQFTNERLSLLKSALPDVSFRPPALWSIPGFESIRSSDLLSCIRDQFGTSPLFEANYGAAYFPFIVCTDEAADSYLDTVLELDDNIRRSSSLSACFHFGCYAKGEPSQPSVQAWPDDVLDSRARPLGPWAYELRRNVRRSWLGQQIRRAKRTLKR